MNPVSEIKNDISGLEALSDWLGDNGRAVDPLVANARARICQRCASNIAPNWWGQVKSLIADYIKAELEIKNSMKLSVEDEDKMGMCGVCGCCNRLAVWAPIQHIKAHTTKDTLVNYPAFCWKKLEILDKI